MKQGIHEVNSMEELWDIRSSVLGKSDFLVEARCLEPDQSDEKGINLGFYGEGRLLSTFRGLPVHSARELEENLDYVDTVHLPLSYPGIVFGKACSRPDVRGKGHIRALYEMMMKRACEGKFHFVALTTKPSNPLNDFLLQEGFEKVENPAGWHRFGYQSGGLTFVFVKRLSSTL